MNIVPRSVSYCTRTLAQYDILLGTIFTNIHAITLYYYIRLYFTVFLLARSNTHDIPFSNILISKKQFLCNKKSMNEITWHESAIWFFIAQKLLFANQYARKFHKISKLSN
jgi:hypothetical protein